MTNHIIDSGITIDIELIERVTGGNRQFEVLFATRKDIHHYPTWYTLAFGHVLEFRYVIEEGFINRSYEFSSPSPWSSSIALVGNSTLTESFLKNVPWYGTSKEVMHYILFDRTDTVIELLTFEKPILTKVERPDNVKSVIMVYPIED
jgi:hypothetical protein